MLAMRLPCTNKSRWTHTHAEHWQLSFTSMAPCLASRSGHHIVSDLLTQLLIRSSQSAAHQPAWPRDASLVCTNKS